MYGNDFMRYKAIRDVINSMGDDSPVLFNEQTGEVTPLHVDVVNSPPHYKTGGIEAIEGIEASMGPEAFAGYAKGSCLKYLWRYEKKGKPLEDLKKARWFLDRLIAAQEKMSSQG
jgi:hypothetical protein